MDVDARMQLFDLKTKYQFQTTPTVDKYNMPLYNVQTEGGQSVASYPVYQGFLGPAYINGIPVGFQTQKQSFFRNWPNLVQNLPAVSIGDGGNTYTLQVPILPNNPTPPNPPLSSLLRGHVDLLGIISTGNNVDPIFATIINTGIPTTSIESAVYVYSTDANGNNIIVQDSGQFLLAGGINYPNYGLLMQPGNAPTGNLALTGTYSTTVNTINYLTGVINVTFPAAIPAGMNIGVQCYFFQTGLPREILFNNNCLTLRNPPDKQYLVELDAYLSPAAFLSTSQAMPFGYMTEYLARGAARKILSDTGDVEQFMFYEPLFREQELLVWKRSQRQLTSTRTETIYSQGMSNRYGGTYGGVIL